ncbi:endonuclease I family protein [Bacteriovorax sp. Seq25_V]|uniref:endonuclease I family protein n=1 Tax=Bacteriovorax sp. Seq25_V TaxID=1201288 RepID=UPI000389E528|nr:endonuclease [Bacteriovorax sp. Seq25_V]EQC43947.1 nuclease, EndA/NucM family [Bacteriovorax sp. Seq25_V]
MKISKRNKLNLSLTLLISFNCFGFYRSQLPVVDISYYEKDPSLYYGQELLEKKSGDIKSILRTILNSAHIIIENAPDRLSNECDEGTCYSHTTLGYKRARQILFGQVYQPTEEHTVTEIYCGKTYTDGQIVDGAQIRLQENQIPNGNILNTEHTWPRSRFEVDEDENPDQYEQMLSDIHHLYPTDTIVNRDRYNHQFGDVDEVVTKLTCDGPKLGHNNAESMTMFFEPPTEVKGDIARSLMYFSVKYNLPLGEVEETSLRRWHKLDPVSEFEVRKNNIVHAYQGTRNPFIDFPELESKIADF